MRLAGRDVIGEIDRILKRTGNVMFQAAIIRELGPDHASTVIDRVDRTCREVNSEERLDVLLALTRCKPAMVFWPVFFDQWPHCDDTWHLRDRLLSELRRHHSEEPGLGYLSDRARAFLDSLPDPVQVFRGCSWRRVMGVSWTTDRSVAAKFAHGHRGIRVPGPIIAAGLAPKSAIFGVFVCRSESEVILDPRQVDELQVSPAWEAAA